jgi:hypothetical protein
MLAGEMWGKSCGICRTYKKEILIFEFRIRDDMEILLRLRHIMLELGLK